MDLKRHLLKVPLFLSLCFALGLGMNLSSGCKSSAPTHAKYIGLTMGTVPYEIFVTDSGLSPKKRSSLGEAIRRELTLLNQQMSTYIPDSEISEFNRMRLTDQLKVSPEFFEVTMYALLFHSSTQGAFDPTVGALVEHYGFGPTNPDEDRSQASWESVKAKMGMSNVNAQRGQIWKSNPDIEIDLGGVAKGYAVDHITRLLYDHGMTNSYVEIGGEIRTQGYNHKGEAWPTKIRDPGSKTIAVWRQPFLLKNRSIATSGTYEQHRVDPETGLMLSHLIDPRTGKPVVTDLVSVSVVVAEGTPSALDPKGIFKNQCMQADALSTAFFVLGKDEGMKLAKSIEGLEALFIYRTKSGELKDVITPGLEAEMNAFKEAEANAKTADAAQNAGAAKTNGSSE